MPAHKHIYEVPGGWYVIIKRGPVTYRAFFAHSAFRFPLSALSAALAARDAFLANYPQTYSGQPVRSSTGVQGVSECTKWFHNRPYPCFQVTLGHPRNGIKRFFYKTEAQRPRALRDAIAWRKKLEAAASLDCAGRAPAATALSNASPSKRRGAALPAAVQNPEATHD